MLPTDAVPGCTAFGGMSDVQNPEWGQWRRRPPGRHDVVVALKARTGVNVVLLKSIARTDGIDAAGPKVL
jgi:hypothetical protein